MEENDIGVVALEGWAEELFDVRNPVFVVFGLKCFLRKKSYWCCRCNTYWQAKRVLHQQIYRGEFNLSE